MAVSDIASSAYNVIMSLLNHKYKKVEKENFQRASTILIVSSIDKIAEVFDPSPIDCSQKIENILNNPLKAYEMDKCQKCLHGKPRLVSFGQKFTILRSFHHGCHGIPST